jgi:uncharacterized protein YceH (UPF0502 family)
MEISSEQARVLGCLIEKEMTPQLSYPLSLNGLVSACNQKSNRHPVVDYDEGTVLHAVDQLRERLLVETVFPGGSRVAKYKHNALYHFGLNSRLQAILGVLLLRGPQTAGEIRTRTERMASFDSIEAVVSNLNELISRDEGALVCMLPPGPGQKERRYMHLLCGQAAAEKAGRSAAGSAHDPPGRASGELLERLERLEAAVAKLERRLDRITGSEDTREPGTSTFE